MARKFTTSYSRKTGQSKPVTDIFHSVDYLKMSAKQRNELAFKTDAELKALGVKQDDIKRLRGFAEAESQRSVNWNYNHPNYKRNKRKN